MAVDQECKPSGENTSGVCVLVVDNADNLVATASTKGKGKAKGKEMIDLSKLQNGVRVRAQFSRRDNAEGTAPEWGQLQVVTLYVQRREATIKRGRVVYPAGEIIVLTPKETQTKKGWAAMNWAEYGERDYSPEYDEWLVEEYRMKILEVLP